MINRNFQNESDIQMIRELMQNLPHKPTVVDFEETILLQSVQATTRLWLQDESLVAFAFVDAYNNLRFEVAPQAHSLQLEDEIYEWGVRCIKKRNAETGKSDTLDACFTPQDKWQLAMLERLGFEQEDIRTLRYERSLGDPLTPSPLPEGFSWRSVTGAQEAEALVALHRAAFGTENMTVEERLAIMQAPEYERELDLVVIAPNGQLAAFCICGIEDGVGYTDPIGTHPGYQRWGLGKAITAIGLQLLQDRNVAIVELGTNNLNIAMQKLAESLGFNCVSEKLWFAKSIE